MRTLELQHRLFNSPLQLSNHLNLLHSQLSTCPCLSRHERLAKVLVCYHALARFCLKDKWSADVRKEREHASDLCLGSWFSEDCSYNVRVSGTCGRDGVAFVNC